MINVIICMGRIYLSIAKISTVWYVIFSYDKHNNDYFAGCIRRIVFQYLNPIKHWRYKQYNADMHTMTLFNATGMKS